jgi:hypothetical protein
MPIVSLDAMRQGERLLSNPTDSLLAAKRKDVVDVNSHYTH